jgi:Tol biopolymer transport system component
MNLNHRLLASFGTLALTAALFTTHGAAAAETGGSISPPQRVSTITLPATIAFTNDHHLWLLDASNPKSNPRQVTKAGSVEIVGWSHDGEWLMFLRHEKADSYASPPFLWVVSADGSEAIQVDARPVVGKPVWSPAYWNIAYFTTDAQNERHLAIAEIKRHQKAQRRQLVTAADVEEITWMPDGNGLLGSIPAARNRPMQLVKLDLTGKRTETYLLGNPPNVEEGIYPYLADGLTVSPDDRYVAYFERLNSASLSADGVLIKLFDLRESGQPKELGTGLAYPEWFAWSPDSKRLAYIVGTDRVATVNKRLAVIDAATGNRIVEGKQTDQVETQPKWSIAPDSDLYYARGKGTQAWLGNYDPNKVLVPGQRIWVRTAAGAMQPATHGDNKTADYYPNPSPDGKVLLFLRADGAEHGSLMVKRGVQAGEQELLRHVTGEPGYYGNNLPAWIQVYWKK